MLTLCKYCGKETDMDGTELCDRCWELESDIGNDIELAEKILNTLKELNKL